MNVITFLKPIIPTKAKAHLVKYQSIIYRFVSYGFNWKGKKLNVCVLSDGSRPTFFGYHDKTPFSKDGTKILAMSIAANDTKAENECTPMKLGYFTKNDNGAFESRFIPFAETTTWCWQQGCMLQWHSLQLNTQVIFNTLVNDEYGSVVFDIEKKSIIKEYSYPVYSVDPSGRYAATLNFSRLGRLRPGYGYGLLPDKTKGIATPKDDGLFLFDMESGRKELIVNLADLAINSGKQHVEHYINHASFSPDGKRIIFFHIRLSQDKNRNIIFCCYNLEDKDYYVLENNKAVSHFCWINSSEILASTKVSGEKMKFTIYDIDDRSSREISELKNGDTHPMRSPVKEALFILDSYPDKKWDQHLFLFNIENMQHKKIASFYSPIKYRGHVRCDLHPRWDREGKYIVVDSARNGKRKMFLVKDDESMK